MTEQTDLARLCWDYRAKEKITQAEMGKRCRVSRETINKIEHGQTFGKFTEAKIRMTIEGRK